MSRISSLVKKISMSRVAVLGVLLLSACGGGGDSGQLVPPSSGLASPELSMSYGLKQFRFSWLSVSGATHYRLLENADGLSPYSLIWEGSATSYVHEVALYTRTHASYMLEACDVSSCSQSAVLPITGTLSDAVGYLKASNPVSWSRFGQAVVLSGDGKTLLVGAEGAASLYIFIEADGVWTQQQKLDIPIDSPADGSHLNIAMATNGQLLAAFYRGVIYVYERKASGWQPQASLSISPGQDPLFEARIALSADGTRLAAGVSGDAYLYTRDESGWALQTTMPGKGDNLALSADGLWLASATNTGSTVEIFSADASGWTQQSSIALEHGHAPELAFSADARTLAVGDSEEAGGSQGINGDESDQSAYGSGAVYVYVKDASTWTRQAYIKASNAQGHDRFGYTIGLTADGNTLVVGAYGEDGSAVGVNGAQNNGSGPVNSDGGSAGAAYVFSRQAGSWAQLAYLKPTNTQFEEYGRSVSISADGQCIAVGDDYEASASPGIDGDASDNSAYAAGAVFLY